MDLGVRFYLYIKVYSLKYNCLQVYSYNRNQNVLIYYYAPASKGLAEVMLNFLLAFERCNSCSKATAA